MPSAVEVVLARRSKVREIAGKRRLGAEGHPARGVDGLAGGVDGDDRADADAGVELLAGRAESALERTCHCAGAGADVALGDRGGRGSFGGAVAELGVGPGAEVAAAAEIEQHNRGHDRYDLAGLGADGEAGAAFLEEAHHAARGVEAVGAASREHERVDALDEAPRVEQIGLARAGGAAAHLDARDCAVREEQDGRAGQELRVGARVAADEDTGDVDDPVRRPRPAHSASSFRSAAHRCPACAVCSDIVQKVASPSVRVRRASSAGLARLIASAVPSTHVAPVRSPHY